MANVREKVDEKDKEERQSSAAGTGLLVAFGLAVLVLVYMISSMFADHEPVAPELPLASVLIQTNGGFDATARAQLVQLQNAISATGVFGKPLGPANQSYLLPGAKPGDDPTVKMLGDMTDAEWATAWNFVSKTDFYVPRMFRLDGNACVIRLDPKDPKHGWESGAGSKLEKALEPFRDKFKSVRAYSHSLGIGSPEDRDALNASFGCNLLYIYVGESAMGGAPEQNPHWLTAGGMKQLGTVRDILKNPHFRSITTGASWVTYFWTVTVQAEKQVDLPSKDEEILRAIRFAQGKQIHPNMRYDGKQAAIDTTTDTEGWDQIDLFWELETSLQQDWKVRVDGPITGDMKRPRKLKGQAPTPK